MGCVPAARVAVVSLAVADAPVPEALSVPVPIEAPLSRKVTVPVGTMVPEVGETVAVKVTDVVKNTGLAFVTTDVAVGCVLMTVKFWQAELPV